MNGLFDSDLLLSPPERQRIVLRKALEARRDNWRHEGYLYRSAGDLLLQHGTFYSGRQLPDEYAHLRGVPGRCFQNALDACDADPTLRYVEGLYAIGAQHYTPHAWCLDPEGRLLEVSLPTDDATLARSLLMPSVPMLPLDRWGYWGAIFHPDFVRLVWSGQQGHVGMLDRPTADKTPGAREWRDEWPILRVPYDPERTTL